MASFSKSRDRHDLRHAREVEAFQAGTRFDLFEIGDAGYLRKIDRLTVLKTQSRMVFTRNLSLQIALLAFLKIKGAHCQRFKGRERNRVSPLALQC